MLAALRAPDSTVLLIDEIDRSDQEFEAFLLEFLSDFQISIPERGTVRAAERPVVVLTSNRTRDLHEALRRRCVYHWIDYPTAEREARIVMMRASSVAEATARAVVAAVGKLRREPLSKAPGIAEAVDWAEAATLLNKGGARWPDAFKRSIGVALKDEEDLAFISPAARRADRGGGGVSDRAATAARRARLRFVRGAVARQRLCHRARADHRVPRAIDAARSARARGHPAGRACDAGAAAGAARRLRHAVPNSLPRRRRDSRRRGRGRGRRAAAGRRDAATTSRRSPTKSTNPAKWRCAPKRWSNAASARAGRARRCAGSRAKRRPACRGGAVIGACARGAGPGRTCGEPCANPRATTAR